jgi:hypothetical protein
VNDSPGVHFRVQSEARHQRFEPELDIPLGHSAEDAGNFVHGQARLIANPFLAILAWVLGGSILKRGLEMRNLTLSLTALLGISASLLLIQYHCLDCGATNWAFRARQHLCPRGVARGSMAGAGRSSSPTLSSQIKFWLMLTIVAACYYLLNAATRR